MIAARHLRSLLAATSFALIPSAAALMGCSPELGECYDCGPCGFVGGPNGADGISIYDRGVDPSGAATIELNHDKAGECGGMNGVRYWLHVGMGMVALEERPAGGELDSSVVMYDGKYTWTDRELVMVFEREGADVVFELQEGMMTTFVRCTVATGAMTCAAEMPGGA